MSTIRLNANYVPSFDITGKESALAEQLHKLCSNQQLFHCASLAPVRVLSVFTQFLPTLSLYVGSKAEDRALVSLQKNIWKFNVDGTWFDSRYAPAAFQEMVEQIVTSGLKQVPDNIQNVGDPNGDWNVF
jgi:hypothetical protein